MALRGVTFVCMALLFMRAHAQDIHEFDSRLDRFIARQQRDSALWYTDLKATRCKNADRQGLWAWVYLEVYDMLSDMGDEKEAQAILDKVDREKWRQPANGTEWEPFCYIEVNQAAALLASGQLLQAIERYEVAAARFEEFRYPDFEAVETIYKPLGNCYTRLGADDKALAVFMKAVQIGGDNETIAGLYCNIGIAWWNKGEWAESEHYEQLGLHLDGISSLKRALLLGALAQTLLDEGRKKEASQHAQASLQLLTGPKTPQLIEYRCYLRRLAGMATPDFSEAERLLAGAREDALRVFGNHGRELGKIEIARAELFLRNNDPSAAMVAANRALSAVLPRFLPAQPGDNPDVIQFYEENVISLALRLKAMAAAKAYEINSREPLLQLAFQCHELAWQAEMLLRKTYQYNTSKFRQQNSSRTYDELAMQVVRSLYEKTGDHRYLDAAFDMVERNEAAVLRDAVGDNLIRQHLAGVDARFDQLSTLRQNLSYFERQLLLEPENKQSAQWRIEADQLQTKIRALENDLQKAYPRLNGEDGRNVMQLTAGFKPDEAALEYFTRAGLTDIFLFLPGKQPVWKTIVTPVEWLSEYAAFFRDQNAILANPAGFLDVAWRLFGRLVPPEAAQAGRLLVIPDGVLCNIPFDALLTEAPTENTNLRNAAYLVRKQELCYAWSLQVLASQQKLVSRAPKRALVLAPRFSQGEQGMSPLTFMEEEGPGGSVLAENADATWELLSGQSAQYRVLHLATHAFAGAGERGMTSLVLSDRQIFLPDIYGLSLQADLVTLSACQTGLGQRESGEGVMSFARAFAQAGAACVVSSQWSVNDRSTGRILAEFYRGIDRGQSIGAALRQAKLAYLNDEKAQTALQTPYFWAGLSMVGDNRRLPSAGWPWWIWPGMALLAVAALWIIRKRVIA